MKTCNLCLDSAHQNSDEVWNKPLFESSNFVVLPSLGSLVKGWLLLAPKPHLICMGAIPSSIISEMLEMKHLAVTAVEQRYGPVCIFEHGPARPDSPVGCSVDHAHLHIVPLRVDLVRVSIPFLPPGAQWSSAGLSECQTAFKSGLNYLYIEQPIGAGLITTSERFGSQIFRRAIAHQLGIPNQFNWREHPQTDTVTSTIQDMQKMSGAPIS